MAGMLSYAAAGLAQGLGQGVAARGKAKREEKLRQIKHQREMQRDERQFERNSTLLDKRLSSQEERLDKRLDAEGNRIAGSFTDNQGNVMGYTRKGGTRPLGQAKTEPVEQQRIVSGDSDLGKQLGLKPGERANVTFRGQQPVKVGDPYTGSGTSGDKQFAVDRKFNMLRQVGYDDKTAAEIANGIKPVNKAELREKALKQAREDVANGLVMMREGETQAEAVRRAANETVSYITDENQQTGGGQGGGQDGGQGGGRGTADAGGSRAPRSDAAGEQSGAVGQALFGGGSSSQPKSNAMTPKSQRGQSGQSQQSSQSSSQPADSGPSGASVQAPKSPSAVQQMEIESLRRYVESADKGELENLPMSVRSEIVKRLRGNE